MSGDVCPGFQSQSGFLTCVLPRLHTSILVLDLLASILIAKQTASSFTEHCICSDDVRMLFHVDSCSP